ncbi:MAG TPA: hypothetical protein VFZ59_26610 [Verrucomicrobiae bacterium]|nr:hypothetical protein [Verrucomicrobiae bacterium]
MPKDEFDFEDPFELNGMAFMTHEDTTNDMAETFTEEFMRMGYGHQQILALFRNPHYLGPNMALEKRGELFIRDLITEVFARWGKKVEWPVIATSPLTPALSPSEGARENCSQSPPELVAAGCTTTSECSEARLALSPRPLGGGEGQGEGALCEPEVDLPAQIIAPDSSLTDPMGAPIPKLNL